MVTALLVSKDMETPQQMVKLLMVYVQSITVQIQPQTLIAKYLYQEDNVNNVLKASSKLAENVFHYPQDV